MPLCFGASGSVRTKVSSTSAWCAPDVHTFCPLTTKWSPSRTARVAAPARSEPAPGSLMPSDAVISARRIGTAHRCFCSSVPNDSIDGAMMPRPCGLKRGRSAAAPVPRGGRTAGGPWRCGRRTRAGCPAAASRGRTARAASDVARARVGAALAATAVRPRVAASRETHRNSVAAMRTSSSSSCTVRNLRGAGSITPSTRRGLGIIAASLLSFGTDQQKQRWAVPILRAEMTAWFGMSEPGAGSDLAGLATRADSRDGDSSSSTGRRCGPPAPTTPTCCCFVRTDPDAPKHKASRAADPTDTPGIERRPFATVNDRDDLDFNEVFFTDVRVPAENLVGPLNGGWGVANGSLGHERTMMWRGLPIGWGSCSRLPADGGWTATATPPSRWIIERCACWARALGQATRGAGIAGYFGAEGARVGGRAERVRRALEPRRRRHGDPALTAPSTPTAQTCSPAAGSRASSAATRAPLRAARRRSSATSSPSEFSSRALKLLQSLL